jgi:hypothetical protein
VSPLWRDETRIWIAPGEIRISRFNRGVRPTPAGEVTRRVESSGLQWQPALSAIESLLQDAQWCAKNVQVVISNLWTRYAIVPWAPDVVSGEERGAYARICLSQIYGTVDDTWRVTLSESQTGRASVACAVPEALIGSLRVLLNARGLRLASLQPLLIASYNQWVRRIPDGPAWFVCVEEGALTAARLAIGEWDRVYAARIGQDWSVELLRLQAFARMASSPGASVRVFVHAPARLRELAGVDESGLEWLSDEPSQPASATVVRLPV